MKKYILFVFILSLFLVNTLICARLSNPAGAIRFVNDTIFNDSCFNDYWGKFDFADTANWGSNREMTETLFSKYITRSLGVDFMEMNDANNKLLSMLEKHEEAFIYFWNLYDKYYYDPDSPYRNEALYSNILSRILKSTAISENNKIRAMYQWQLLQKNKVGFPAEDFSFVMSSGLKRNLYSVENDFIILFFNIPDCEECIRVKKILEKWSVSLKQISVVAIYPDNDYLLWDNEEYPKEWINGFDKEQVILKNELYDLRAFPTIYLLDRNKRVILKDPSIAELLGFYQNFIKQKMDDSISK